MPLDTAKHTRLQFRFDRHTNQPGVMFVVIQMIGDEGCRPDPLSSCFVLPIPTGCDMFEDILISKCIAYVSARCLAIAEDRRKSEDSVEGFIPFC